MDDIVKRCRAEYGDAHDAHMAINGECPWCGTCDPDQNEFLTVDQVVERWG